MQCALYIEQLKDLFRIGRIHLCTKKFLLKVEGSFLISRETIIKCSGLQQKKAELILEIKCEHFILKAINAGIDILKVWEFFHILQYLKQCGYIYDMF